MEGNFTPRELVSELDRYIIGQAQAKRAVAIALRNRWRRMQIAPPLRDEIAPRNIIMIGPTGVGKTEIARRLAKLAHAPFLKVEASKFTEVGYVGRDVDSMIRDLTEIAVGLVRQQETAKVLVRAEELAEERVLDLLLPAAPAVAPAGDDATGQGSHVRTRERLRAKLRAGDLDERKVEVDVEDRGNPSVEVISTVSGFEEMDINFRDMLGSLFPRRTRKRKIPVPEALEILKQQEAQKLVDSDAVHKAAIRAVEQSGIVFIDELDKVAGREGGRGPDVSREGVQRDLLPIIEGSTVNTKYGLVRTDHILFIAAGAFHVAKVSDLIPELQGRFPIRVELSSLGCAEFVRILREPENSLIKQYGALLATEGVDIDFTDEAIEEIAAISADVNQRLENIGARRLITVMERLLEDISFRAPEMPKQQFEVTRDYVRSRLQDVVADHDLSRYIL